MRAATVAVAALVLLAGCSYDAAPPRTRTVTPAPVPTDPTPSVLAPGVSAEGVDSLALVNAHADIVASRTHTLVASRVVRYADGRLRSRVVQSVRTAPDGSFNTTVASRGGPSTPATPARSPLPSGPTAPASPNASSSTGR